MSFSKIFCIPLLVTLFISVFIFKSSAQDSFTFCQSIDDNWNPVGASSVMQGSSGINFLVKLTDKQFSQNYVWAIYRTDSGGKDVEWVNEFVMTLEDPAATTTGFRYFCTTDKVYLKPGSYRVYFMNENDKETQYKSGNLTKYIAKGEVTVQ